MRRVGGVSEEKGQLTAFIALYFLTSVDKKRQIVKPNRIYVSFYPNLKNEKKKKV